MELHIPDELMQKQIALAIVTIATAEIEKRMKLLTKTLELPPYGNKETIKQVLGIGDKKLNKWISMGLKIQVWSPQDIRIERESLVRVSFKLDAMSIQEFLPFIQKEIADRIGVALGTKVFTGTGTGEPKGLLTELKAEASTPQVVEYDAATVPTYANLTQLMTKVHPTYVSGAKIYANNNTIWLKLANIVDGENRPVFIPDATSGGVGRLFGYTVVMDGGLADGEILFANGEAGMVQNTNEPLSIQSQKDLTSRETIYLGYMITDWAVLDTKAFGLLEPKAGE